MCPRTHAEYFLSRALTLRYTCVTAVAVRIMTYVRGDFISAAADDMTISMNTHARIRTASENQTASRFCMAVEQEKQEREKAT